MPPAIQNHAILRLCVTVTCFTVTWFTVTCFTVTCFNLQVTAADGDRSTGLAPGRSRRMVACLGPRRAHPSPNRTRILAASLIMGHHDTRGSTIMMLITGTDGCNGSLGRPAPLPSPSPNFNLNSDHDVPGDGTAVVVLAPGPVTATGPPRRWLTGGSLADSRSEAAGADSDRY